MFSANPRGWNNSDPTPEECERFRAARISYNLTPVVIHVNYLTNLASAEPVIREKSIAAFRGELRRALAVWSRSSRDFPNQTARANG